MNKSRILLALMLIIGAGGAVATGTTAFFSDTEISAGNIFTAGNVDLQIANESYYNGVLNAGTSWAMTNLTTQRFFDFDDVKPGDYGEDTISLHVYTNDAYLCADVTLTSNEENGINGPEALAGDTTDGPGEGELAGEIYFIWWADDGDNVLEDDEIVISQGPIDALPLGVTTTVALADSVENIWTGSGGPIQGDTTYHIGKAWCFGELTLAPVPQGDNDPTVNPGFTCNGANVGNQAQTDSLTADISFRAVQARNNPGFLCTTPDEPPAFQACTDPALAYADHVVEWDQGVRKNGTSVLAARSNPNSVLGAPESLGGFYDNPTPADSTFFSLGFKNGGTTEGGSIVVEFTDNIVFDGPGNDLKVWEVTGGGNYPDERVKVEVSQDGINWYVVAASAVRDAEIDIAPSGLAWAAFVRLTDVTPIGPFEAIADGYDVDAVSALNCALPLNGNGNGGPTPN